MGAEATRATQLRDRVAFGRLVDLRDRLGPDRLAGGAVHVRSPIHALALVLVARGATVEQVINTLRLDPGDLAKACPTPTVTPLPPGERTVIPDELPVNDDPYARRRRLVTLGDVPEPAAAALAVMVSGVRGLVLFMIARGDDRYDVAKTLGITIEAVDTILADTDGDHLVRTE